RRGREVLALRECAYSDGGRDDDVLVWRAARLDSRHFTSALRYGARSFVLQRPLQSFPAYSCADSITGGAWRLVERAGAVWFLRPTDRRGSFRTDALLRFRGRIGFHLSPSHAGRAPAISHLGISGRSRCFLSG